MRGGRGGEAASWGKKEGPGRRFSYRVPTIYWGRQADRAALPVRERTTAPTSQQSHGHSSMDHLLSGSIHPASCGHGTRKPGTVPSGSVPPERRFHEPVSSHRRGVEW